MKTLEHLSFQEIYDYVNSFEVVLKNPNLNKLQIAVAAYHDAHFTADRNIQLTDETYFKQLAKLVYKHINPQPNA